MTTLPDYTQDCPLAYQVATAACADLGWQRQGSPDMPTETDVWRYLQPAVDDVRVLAANGMGAARIVAVRGATVPDGYRGTLSEAVPGPTTDNQPQRSAAPKNLFSQD